MKAKAKKVMRNTTQSTIPYSRLTEAKQMMVSNARIPDSDGMIASKEIERKQRTIPNTKSFSSNFFFNRLLSFLFFYR